MLIETISLEDALNLFSLPREVGFFEDQPMTIGIGKFGPYVKHDNKYVSLTKEDDPYTIPAERAIELIQQKRAESVSEALGEYEGTLVATGKGRFGPYVKHNDKYISIPRNESLATLSLDRAIELIQQKRQAEANKYIKEFPENPAVKVVNGQYGPYLAVGKRNVKIPKDTDPTTLTLEQCLELAGGEPTPAAGKAAAKKAAPAKAAAKAPAKAKAATTVRKPATVAKKTVAKKK
jgi:DNA topoisomerase-1